MTFPSDPDVACVWHGGLTQPDTGTKGELLPRFILPTMFRLEFAHPFEALGAVFWTREDQMGRPVRLKHNPNERHAWRRAYDPALVARKAQQRSQHGS